MFSLLNSLFLSVGILFIIYVHLILEQHLMVQIISLCIIPYNQKITRYTRPNAWFTLKTSMGVGVYDSANILFLRDSTQWYRFYQSLLNLIIYF